MSADDNLFCLRKRRLGFQIRFLSALTYTSVTLGFFVCLFVLFFKVALSMSGRSHMVTDILVWREMDQAVIQRWIW